MNTQILGGGARTPAAGAAGASKQGQNQIRKCMHKFSSNKQAALDCCDKVLASHKKQCKDTVNAKKNWGTRPAAAVEADLSKCLNAKTEAAGCACL